MLIFSRPASHLRESAVTPRDLVLSRRTLLAGAGAAALTTAALPASAGFGAPTTVRPADAAADAATPFTSATTYNNFVEFGSGKSDPSRYARALPTRPWQVVVDGAVAKPAAFGIEDLLRFPLEERIYRLRCVEGWSMVIPWTGFSLAALLNRVEPTGGARYVVFQTAVDAKAMPGTRIPTLDWPYTEGLRLDEAMHPLTIMAVGMYGDPLPNQNGAPVRLVVPWKYGFKSIKSVVRITLAADQPPTAWNALQPEEYGFYANVNPAVSHPRWSQATERRVGDFFRRKTLPFNGYGEEVASLYAGMDLRTHY